MAPHQHLLQLTLQPAFSSRTLRPHNIKHSALSHSSHYLILTHCFHLVSENGKGDPRSNDTEVIKHHNIFFFFFWGGEGPGPKLLQEQSYRCFLPVKFTEEDMKWKSIFPKAATRKTDAAHKICIPFREKTTSHNFTQWSLWWKGMAAFFWSSEITITWKKNPSRPARLPGLHQHGSNLSAHLRDHPKEGGEGTGGE